MGKKYSAPAADGVLDLLEFMTDHPGAWGVTELSRQTGIGNNLVFRIMNVLAEHDYAERSETGKYELSAKLFSLGMRLRNRFELRNMAHPSLCRLAEETGETVQIQIPDGDRMLSIDCVYPPRDYYLVIASGARIYYHGNAFGKAVLAFLPKEEQDAVLKKKLCRMTPETVVSLPALRAEFEQIRKTFSASEDGEYVRGSYCIGSPVFDAAGKVAAGVGITALNSRDGEHSREELIRMVLDCAIEITKKIGGSYPMKKADC